ncbi:MAG: translation initiation factor IF-2 [Gammaproteobacteria bacterium]|nr:translation initiation factor IF-2 [Gammaproteobacteria bacterium]
MANVTAKQLSEVIGVSVEKLLAQLNTAGVDVSSENDPISDEDKLKLLESLRSSHGKETEAGPKKITLRRKSKSELRVSGSSGRNTTTKTINVEVRKKRTYVRRADVEAEEARVQEEAQAQAEEESRLLQEQAEAEARREQEEAEAAAAAELAAQEEAARAEAEQKAIAKSMQEAEVARAAIEKKRAEEEAAAAAEQAQRAALEQAAAASAAAAQDKPGKHGKHEDRSTRYGRKELHVKESAHQPNRKQKFKKGQRQVQEITRQHEFVKPTAPVVRNVEIPDAITVAELGQRMAIKAGDVIKVLMQMGTMATINEVLDRDTATLVVEEMGHNVVTAASEDDFEKELQASAEQAGEERVSRPPVVTIMGHVDHGKTSLLDYIRESRVTSGEAGGITQHIGAYHVETDKGIITFLDTPGHAAFSAMRARGAQATDIVVLVVAADDGVMPQTKEAIQHARAAEVPLVVAVNKIDREEADPDRVKNELAALEVIPEEWGGENIFVNVSAITGEGVGDLLDSILLQSEILELGAVDKGNAKGIVVEASLDKGRGPVATVLVQSGLLQQGQMLLAGTQFGRVRAMYDEDAKTIKSAGPSMPAVVLGLSGVPNAGDEVFVVENERKAREFAEIRESRIRETKLADQQKAKLQGMFDAMAEGEVAEINILVKADVQGSSEAIRESLEKLSTDEVRTKLVATGVGGINESDINLAAASEAVVIGFNVRADASAKRVAGDYGIDIRYYSVIYDIIDDIKSMMSGMLSPESQENIIGLAEVKEVFRSPKFGDVAGSIVVEGVVRKGQPIRVLRDNVVIYEGELESLRRFKDNVEEVRMGTECGIAVKNYTDVKPGDQIEVFERVEVARSID